MAYYITGYRKYSEALQQRFRMQLLCTEGKWWLRFCFHPSLEKVEVDLPDTFDSHKFLEEAKMLCYWCYYRRRCDCPYTGQVFEENDVCSKLYKVWYTQQQLFKYEENPDIYLSVLVKLTSREPTNTWEKYSQDTFNNSGYKHW